jgi:probable selenium-dependent hydroxylase accessory protein YqeC
MLIQALGLERSRLISLCGAGGKTTLMVSLAREFVAAGERVLVTTTTKIARDEADGWRSLAGASASQVLENARTLLPETGQDRAGALIAYSQVGGDGYRLVGFAPELIDEVAQAGRFDRILVEADGSARKPLKAPAAHEPVIPSATDALLIVAGINGLGLPLSEDNLFQRQSGRGLAGLCSASRSAPNRLPDAWRTPTDSLAAVLQKPVGYCSSIRPIRRLGAPRRSGLPSTSLQCRRTRWSGR